MIAATWSGKVSFRGWKETRFGRELKADGKMLSTCYDGTLSVLLGFKLCVLLLK